MTQADGFVEGRASRIIACRRLSGLGMHRFYLPPEQCAGPEIHLSGSEAHHAAHVLRIRAGEEVIVLDGSGGEYHCELKGSTRDRLTLAVMTRKKHPAPACLITLLQAVPKGKLMETIVQKATELGASRVVPLLSTRVALQIDADTGQRKAGKWQTVAIEAIKQCGAPYLPEISLPLSPKQFLARGEHFDLALVASLQPGSRHPREYFDEFGKREGRKPGSACIWIGPEGDFTPDEYREIQSGGALPITLGSLILRTDTAAGYCLSILNYEFSSSDVDGSSVFGPAPQKNAQGGPDS